MKFLRFSAIFAVLTLLTFASATAQPVADDEGDVAIGSLAPDVTAILDLVSTERGFLVPRMSQIDRDVIAAPADALMIFNTTTSEFNYWDPSTGQWEVFITSANIEDYAWVLGGNNLDIAIDPTLQDAYDGIAGAFLGTNSADDAVIATTQTQDINFFTDGTERFSVTAADGNIVPTNDNDITLGTDDNRFADAYVNGASVHIGPSGGAAGDTEMNLGYDAGLGTVNVDGTNPEIAIDPGTGGAGGGVSVDGDADGNVDLFSDGLNGDVTIGNDDGVDVTTLNGRTVLNESFNSPAGAFIINESNRGQGIIVNETGNGTGIVVNATGIGGGIVINEAGNNQGMLINSSGGGPGLQVEVPGGTGILVNGGSIRGNASGNTLGELGTNAQQLTVNGLVNATVASTLAGNANHWDLVVTGDAITEGIHKFGGSIWVDGVTGGNHQIIADDALNLGTTTASDLTLSTSGVTAATIDGGTQLATFNGGITSVLAPNTLGATTVNGTMAVTGASTFTGTVDMNNTTLTLNNTGITQTGPAVNLGGVVNATNGVNVSGADLTVNNASIQAPGSGHVMGTNGVDANVLTIEGANGGATELDVNGDINVSGGIVIGSITQGSVLFAGLGNQIDDDNANFFWDDANNRLGIGNNAPAQPLDVTGRVNSTESYDIDGNRFLWNGPAGTNNTFVGNTGNTATTGDFNTFVGSRAGVNNASGAYNTFIGYQAGFTTTTGQFNIAIGSNAGLLMNGFSNVIMGWSAGSTLGAATGNTMIGHNAGSATTTGSLNTFFGHTSGQANTIGINNTALGQNADFGANNLTNATAIGTNAQVNQSNAIVLGSINGVNGAAATVNVGIGTTTPSVRLDVAGRVNSTESYDIDGNRFLWDGPAGTDNTFVGNTGNTANTGIRNTFVGRTAGSANTSGGSNTMIGFSAGTANLDGGANTFVGNRAGALHTTGSFNTFVGNNAGDENDGGGDNTFVGHDVGHRNTSGTRNTFFGTAAGNFTTIGGNNTFIGRLAGTANVNGTGNTMLGESSNLGGPALSNATAIGRNAVVSQSNAVVLGEVGVANVGIGTSTPSARLNVVGDVTIETGDVILPYGTIASGGTIGNNSVTVLVTGNGIGGAAITVSLPAAGTNGQVIVVATDDPDGMTVNGESTGFGYGVADQHTAVRFVRMGGAWIAED